MATDRPQHIAEIRGNASLWTPAQALRAFLDDIESGRRPAPTKAVVLFFQPGPDGEEQFGYHAGGTLSNSDRAHLCGLGQFEAYLEIFDCG